MTDYPLLADQIRALAEEDARWPPLLANASALVMDAVPDLNWAGFYLADAGGLVLGPFQGRAACVRIASGHGVCGTAMAEDRTLCVTDVHAFPGHIACDSASASELVVPIHADGHVVAVLDLDSPTPARFSPADADGLGLVARALEAVVRWDPPLG